MDSRFKEQLTNDATDIIGGLKNAAIIFIKASPIIFVGWILFIAPNC